jgi:polyphosphate:AMP phosphotransferase
MFESAERNHVVANATYERELPKLRAALLSAQADVLERKAFPVVVLISGVEGAGKGDTLHVLHEWLDPRHVRASAFDAPDAVESRYPPMWRFWQALPLAGTTAIFFGAWYREALYARVYGGEKRSRLDAIVRFERMLTDEGALVLKLWLHLSKKQQHAKLEELSSSKRTRWRVKGSDWRNHEHYDDFRAVAKGMIRKTHTPAAPWLVVAGGDANHRRLTVGRALLDAMRGRLAEPRTPARGVRRIAAKVELAEGIESLRDLDTSSAREPGDYPQRLARAQAEIAALSREASKEGRASILVFEGPDAAGKGGAIRRVTDALDARHFRVNAVAAPNDVERAHPYLWRFWTNIPRDGDVGIFDRSWYGRTLVERVEGFAPESAWSRAYSEINDFESDLVAHGAIVLKFWLQITKEEQLARFHAREQEAYKRYKLTREDWRNRRNWDAYEQAADDTFARTSTKHAPWTLIAANDKHYARVAVLETFATRLRRAFESK